MGWAALVAVSGALIHTICTCWKEGVCVTKSTKQAGDDVYHDIYCPQSNPRSESPVAGLPWVTPFSCDLSALRWKQTHIFTTVHILSLNSF